MDEQQQQTPWQQNEPVVEQPQQDDKKKKFAIAGFVLGLVGLVAWLVPILGLADGIVGIIMSVKGLKSEKRTFALIGLILSIVGIVASIVFWIYGIVVAMNTIANLNF
jgi:hypothetical protein